MEDERSYRADFRVDDEKGTRRVRVDEERAYQRPRERYADEEDEGRGERRTRRWGSFSVSSDTATDYYQGLARSIAEGLRAYERELDANNVTRVGLDNGHIEGLLSGTATFWSELASTMRRTVDDLRADREEARSRERRTSSRERAPRGRPAGERDDARDERPDIDYERLAKLIAREMQKPPEPAVPPPPPAPPISRE